jgi:hypothetical protein
MTDETPSAPQFFAELPPVIGGGANLTPAQAREMADAIVQHGGMSREAADAALKAGGHEPAPADTRTDEAKAFDASFAAAAPNDYKLDYIGRLPTGTATATVAEFNQIATSWLSEIGLPPNIGPSVIERSMEVGQRNAQLTPAARELWRREQAVQFDRVARTPERAAALRAFADQALARGGKPFTDVLRKSGALDDATVLMNLALQGERAAARSNMK